jgi:DNA-binding CsgD family transcriptional regulator/DNA-binding transcriptional ArsR family regulator
VLARTRELEEIKTTLRRPDAVGVALTGVAGVGKSTLLGEAADAAALEGFAVVRVFGSRATSTLPLCAFSSFFANATSDQSTERFATVRRALADHSASRPLLIAIDDIHLLDDASAVLVSQLARERAAFVLCTIRGGEPAPESVASLWTQRLMPVLTVSPFDRDASLDIATSTLGGPLHAGLEHELWQRTGGNPLFLRELALGSRASGAIALIDGLWTQVRPLEASTALADLVGRNLDALTSEQQHALCCVALSEPVSASLVERVADDESLIALEEAGLISVSQDRRRTVVRLTHPLYGEIIRTQTSQLRARKIRRQLAEAVEGWGTRRRDDVLKVSTWRLESGDVDPDRFVRASLDAIRNYDVELAERLASAAHDHAPSLGTVRALAMSRLMLGRPHESLDAITPMLEATEAGGNDWIRLGFLEGVIRFQGLGDYDGALAALRRVTGAETAPETRRRADAMIAMAELHRGNARESMAIGERLVREGATDPETYSAYIESIAATGRPERALAVEREYVDAHGELPDQYASTKWFPLIDSGDLHAAEALATRAWERATDEADRSQQLLSAFALAHALLHRGQAATSLRWFDTAAALAYDATRPWAHAGRALAYVQLGDLEGARGALDSMDALPHSAALYFEITALRARGWVTAMSGEPVQGRAELLALADRLLAQGFVTQAVRALVDVARLGDVATANARLGELEADVDGRGLLTTIAFVRALAGGDPEQLLTVSDQLAEIGMAALAAEAASAARDALAKDGRARDAGAVARKATELIAQTEGGVTPLFAVVESVVPLTRREREIAALVADGRTSREVAEACFLSVRTVETHLARIYDKLGINSRAELADAIGTLTIGSAA